MNVWCPDRCQVAGAGWGVRVNRQINQAPRVPTRPVRFSAHASSRHNWLKIEVLERAELRTARSERSMAATACKSVVPCGPEA